MRRNEITANNLANANTFGYKKKETAAISFQNVLLNQIDYQKPQSPKVPVGKLGKGVMIDEIFTNYKQGDLVNSDRPLDLALEDAGYFAVQDDQERELYTRNGSFTINSQGFLATQTGHLVLGEKGPIKINSININITEMGEIFADNKLIDKLKVVNIENQEEIGNSLFFGKNPTPKADPQVRQGFIETSNVNSVEEMVKMINIMRSYESNQKIIQSYDNTLDKVINEVGRV